MARFIGLLLILRVIGTTFLLIMLVVVATRLNATTSVTLSSLDTNLTAVEDNLITIAGDTSASLGNLANRAGDIATYITDNIPEITLDIQPLRINAPQALDIDVPLLGNFKDRLDSIAIPIPFAATLNNFAASYNGLTDELETGFRSLENTATTLPDISQETRLITEDVQSLRASVAETLDSLGWLSVVLGGVALLWIVSSFLDTSYRAWMMLFPPGEPSDAATHTHNH